MEHGTQNKLIFCSVLHSAKHKPINTVSLSYSGFVFHISFSSILAVTL